MGLMCPTHENSDQIGGSLLMQSKADASLAVLIENIRLPQIVTFHYKYI